MNVRVTKRAKAIIHDCLITDSNYYKYLHVECGELKKVVNHTFALVNSGCTFYDVQNDAGRSIGYFLIHKNGNIHKLIEFFLCAHVRTKEGVKEFWQLIESKLNNEYLCCCPSKNAKAIKFIQKMGLKEIDRQTMANQVFHIYSKI